MGRLIMLFTLVLRMHLMGRQGSRKLAMKIEITQTRGPSLRKWEGMTPMLHLHRKHLLREVSLRLSSVRRLDLY